MNWDRVEGRWTEMKGKVRERWGRLTSDEIDVINGRREQLEGTIQRAYGKTKDDAKKEVDEFVKNLDDSGCGCG